MSNRLHFHDERQCQQCGERFWGISRALYCSSSCRQQAYRARQPFGMGTTELRDLCARMVDAERGDGASTPRKLLPRLFRAVARELRVQGWDPIELLLTMPDDPVSADDTAPGGVEGEAPARRKWLLSPEEELRRVDEQIAIRRLDGGGIAWYERRRAQLLQVLEKRPKVVG